MKNAAPIFTGAALTRLGRTAVTMTVARSQ